jgi:hypothetical protein
MNFSFNDTELDTNMDDMLNTFNTKTNLIDVQNIYIYFFYVVNQTCEIYKRDIVNLSNGVLLKETLMTEIVKNRNDSGRRFNVSGIYAFNFDTTDLKFVLNNDLSMNEYKNVDNIKFNKSIDFFEHHNSVFVILTNEKSKNTKKSGINNKHKTLKSH